MKEELDKMPEVHVRVLERLLSHCKKVAAMESKNKMGARNLAMVLSPTILYAKEPSVITMVEDMERATQVVILLIEEYEQFKFTGVATPTSSAANGSTSSSSSAAAGKEISAEASEKMAKKKDETREPTVDDITARRNLKGEYSSIFHLF